MVAGSQEAEEFGFLDRDDLVVDMMQGIRGFGEGGEGGDAAEDGAQAAPAFQVHNGISLTKNEILATLADMEAKMNSDQAVRLHSRLELLR